MNKLKRSVIKEELVAITGDFINAIILNQLIYWSERIRDFDKFIEQEKIIAKSHGEKITIDPTHGWIYKSAEELSEETLLKISKQNMRLHIKKLISLGYVQERNNPKYKWDKTKQYRLNMVKIQTDLQKLGYCLEGYPLVLKHDIEVPKNAYRENNLDIQENNLDIQSEQFETAIPENTTETSSDTTSKEIYKESGENEKANIKNEFETIWKEYPNKKGKDKAFTYYKKARESGTSYDEVYTGLQNYLKEIRIQRKERQFIKNGSTWFYNHSWNDEYNFDPPMMSNQKQLVNINGKDYIYKNGEYFIPRGSGIAVNPFAEDDLPF